jgi:hypothetical protein
LFKKAVSATPADAFAEMRRAAVVDSPGRLPADLPQASLRAQGARWEAILDPTPPARLHLFRRQPLWTMEETPARRRLMWIGVANLPFLLPLPRNADGLAAATAWHLDRALGRTARRRVETLALAAGLVAAEHGFETWTLDLATMTVRPGALADLLGGGAGCPLRLRLPEAWLRELPLLLSGERTAMRVGHERLAIRRLIKGRVPGTAHARQAARARLQRLAAAGGVALG